MIIRKTSKTIQKRIYRNAFDARPTRTLYRVDTVWFLFIPLYSSQTCLG